MILPAFKSGFVAIIGRPNVGKSTLFNKLIGYRKAITMDEPGVTRDLNYGEVEGDDFFFTLVDTGGFESDVRPVSAGSKQAEEIPSMIREQVELVVEEADLIICMMDGRSGLMEADREMADMLRVADKPVIYVVNKIDTPKNEPLLSDFFKLGVEPIIPVSAEHSIGIRELLDKIKERLPSISKERVEREETRVAIVGRPNVGKSTLVNRILGFERMIVSQQPGTTRDVVDTVFKKDSKYYRLMDTAGIRRKSRIERQLERYSVMSAIRGIDGCDVAILMIDAQEGVTSQDARIGGLISSKGKGCIIAVNKWDMVTKDTHTMTAYERKIMEKLYFLKFAPVLFISAKIGKRVEKLFPLIDSIAEGLKTKVPTSNLNKVLEKKKKELRLPSWKGKEVKIYYMTQVGINPPTFALFVNHPEALKEAQKRFLIDTLREGLGLKHIPIRLHIRRRE